MQNNFFKKAQILKADISRETTNSIYGSDVTNSMAAYDAVAVLLNKNLPAKARVLLDSSLQKWPEDGKLRLINIDVLFAASSAAEAVTYFMTLLESRGLELWAIARLSKGLSGSKDLDGEMLLNLIDRVKNLEIEKKYLDQLFAGIYKASRKEDRVSILKSIISATDSYAFKCRYAVSLFDSGQLDLALDYLECIHLKEPGTPISLLLHANLLSNKGDFLKAIQLLERGNYKELLDAHCFRLLITLKQVEMQFREAGELLEFCLEKWPEDWILIFRLNRSPLPAEIFQRIYKKLSAHWDEIPKKYGKLAYEYAITCMQAGEIQKSKNILLDVLNDSTCGFMARNLLEGLNKEKFSHPIFKNSRFKDDRCSDFQLVKPLKPSKTAIIIFAMNSINDWPLEMIDAVLEDLNCNIIYLRDFKRKAFLGGVNSLGKSEDETIAKLREILEEMGVNKIITMGASFCGYAAIKYGALLKSAHVLSFAGPNNLQTYYEDTPPSIWNYLYFIQLKTKRAEYSKGDLVHLITDSTNTTFHQFYGEKHPQDKIQAERLSGLNNVCITQLEDLDDHSAVNLMMASNTLIDYLNRLI